MNREKVVKALEDFNKNRVCLPHLIPWGEIADAVTLLKEMEAEIKRLKNELHGYGDLFHALSEKTEKAIAEQPKIVRCEDCANRGNTQSCPVAYIEKENGYKMIGLDDWFCGNGKPKTNDNKTRQNFAPRCTCECDNM